MKTSKWTWVDSVFIAVRGLWFLIWIIIFINNPLFHHLEVPLILLLTWLCFAYIVPQFLMLPRYHNLRLYPVAEQIFTGSLYVYLLLIVQSDSSIMLIPAVILGLYYSKRFMWWSGFAMILVIPVIGFFFGKESFVIYVTHVFNNGIALGVGFAFNRMAMLLKKNQEQYRVIQEQNKTLEQYARKVENLTLLEERNRMARELHDTMGHTFTSVIIGMDGVLSNLARSNYEKANAKLQALRQLTKDGLDEIRISIHQMAPEVDHELLSTRLLILAEEFEAHTNTKVHFKTVGEEFEVSQPIQLMFIRCLQEGLTNAKRHGHADGINITVEFWPEYLSLRIKDDGNGTGSIKAGFGLKGMKERLQSFNGQLTINTKKGEGTEVVCSVPLIRRVGVGNH
jgi:signal transduction histidine kinase